MSQVSHNEEEKPFLDDDQQEPSHNVVIIQRRDRRLVVILATTAVISWLLTIYVVLSRGQYDLRPSSSKKNATSASGDVPINSYFPTDLKALRSTVSYEERVYTGALYYNETTKRFIRNTTSTEPQYVGFPSKAMDDAWEALLRQEWSPMTEEESTPFRPRLTPFAGQYRFEPDMFHSLHCVNEVRKALDIGYYSAAGHGGYKVEQEDWDRIHIDHCLDQIRQAIMCFGDLSPVPLYSWEGSPLGIGQGTVHTCRKWDPVRKWVDQRHLEFND